MDFAPNDERFMREALDLARQGVGLTSPNPAVGAVVVRDGNIVGRGSYTYDGVKHAEVLALEQAGEAARGSMLYLNLEPCSHQGRTGPCAESVIAAGVKRVVAAMRDPNPLVNGQGLEKLRAAGIEVVEGVGEAEARKLNEAFAKYIRQKTPLVTLKAGMTLDGKIAAPPGESESPSAPGAGDASAGWITSEEARAHLQELRHASDAILVGVGTIVADDPLLTDRSGRPRRRPLMRVILDSRLRLPLDSRVVKTANQDVLILCSMAEEKRKQALEAHGVRVEQVAMVSAGRPTASNVRRMPVRRRTGTGAPIKPAPSPGIVPAGRPDMQKVVERLGELEITSVLSEGGALVNWAALAAGIVDKVFLYYAPKILAGTGSVPFAAGEGFRRVSEAAKVKSVTLHRFGEDFAVEGYLLDPYE
ncbi:MAG TPA: bifunctional diaminohydroxyphosphoribosylaminopyrimidine deaminase/5-amino-6-(5-phosphoribosylamino)uracil reductase RibD [Terriglobales bacterium]|nr:bifunctional diaminohydroxyphosphoribosylaminopyrimidine deaminase/5-amino-6-(5-phosphoribosylamino)uracil reductase RibD [Terriglobales bacterium]